MNATKSLLPKQKEVIKHIAPETNQPEIASITRSDVGNVNALQRMADNFSGTSHLSKISSLAPGNQPVSKVGTAPNLVQRTTDEKKQEMKDVIPSGIVQDRINLFEGKSGQDTTGAEPAAEASAVATPDVTTPEVTTPEVTAPEVAAPEVTAPVAAAPEVTAPEVIAPPTAALEGAVSAAGTAASKKPIFNDRKKSNLEIGESSNEEKANEVLELGGKVVEGTDAAFGKDGKIAKAAASAEGLQISGIVIDGVKNLISLYTDAKDFAEKRDFASFAQLLGTGAEVANSILKTLAEYDLVGGAVKDSIPIVGPAISAFQSGVALFKQVTSTQEVRKLTDGMTLTEEEKVAISRYFKTARTGTISKSIDFVLDLGNIAASMFPPGGAIVTGVKTVKNLVLKGIDVWEEYKASAERKSLARLTSSDEDISEEDLASLNKMKSIMDKDKDAKISKPASLLEVVKMKLDYDTVSTELEGAQDDQKEALTTRKTNLETAIRTFLAIYNSIMPKGTTPVTFEDVADITAVYTNTMNQIMMEASTEKGLLGSMRQFFKTEDKERIYKEVFPNGEPITDAKISELGKSKNADYFWGKTQDALKEVTKNGGRKIYSKAEIVARAKKILIAHGVAKDKVEDIISI